MVCFLQISQRRGAAFCKQNKAHISPGQRQGAAQQQSMRQHICAVPPSARGHAALTDCWAPCACLGEQSCWECCFPADGETTARAPVVRKGPGSCRKRQKQSLIRLNRAGIAAQSCLLKQHQPTLMAPLSPSLSTHSSSVLLEAVLCVSQWVQEGKDPEAFPDK